MKKQFRSVLILMVGLLLLLAACGQGNVNTEPSATAPPVFDNAEPLTLEEIDALTELFTQPMGSEDGTKALTNWYNMAMFDSYETPQQVNLNDLFCMGVGDESPLEPTEEEAAFLETQTHIGKWGSTYKIPREIMDEVLQQYFGLTLDETDGVGLDEMAYFEKTDCYYWSISDVRYTLEFEITSACRTAEGNIVFCYSIPHREYMMTIKPVGDGYHILSNIWLNDWTENEN